MSAWLRSGRVIVAEILGLGVGALFAAGLPQEPDRASIADLASRRPALGHLLAALGLHRVVTSWWFLALVALATASLVAVQIDQWRRVFRTWGRAVSPGEVRGWSYRAELPLSRCRPAPPAPSFRTTGRIGQLGSPIFHLGLLLVVVAGLLRLLFFGEGVAVLGEGETLAATPSAFAATRTGLLGGPVATRAPLRLEALSAERYGSGALKQVTAVVAPLGAGVGARRTVSVNDPAPIGGGLTLSIDPDAGEAALFSLRDPLGERAVRVDLDAVPGGRKGRVDLGDGRELRVRSRDGDDGSVEVRLVRGQALLGFGRLRAAEGLAAGPGAVLGFLVLRRWATVRVERDPSRPLFFLGAALAVAGVLLMFGWVRVDTAVVVEGQSLVLALRAQRFPALYAERFERLRRSWEVE